MPGGYAGDRGVRRRRARKTDEADPCCVSVSDSRLGLLCAPMSTVGEAEERQRLPEQHPLSLFCIALLFSPLSPLANKQVDMQSSHIYTPLLTPILTSPHLPSALSLSLSLSLSVSLSLPLSRSLGAIFTSKRLHYLPSLRAIRNGVTLSGRHGHGFITTHPLSWGPLWGPPTLMERILGSQLPLNPPPPNPSTYPQPALPFDW